MPNQPFRPTVSVIIPTLNAENEIGNLLDILAAQSIKPAEILVVDSSSDDKTQQIVTESGVASLRVIKREDFNHGQTRHEALLQTTGDFVLFLTQDAVPVDSLYIENLLKPFADPLVAMASGRQVPKPDARRFEQLVREYNYPATSFVHSVNDIEKYGIKTFFASDVCSAYRRSYYLKVGGFKALNTNEDMLIASDFIFNGYEIAYEADAQVLHSHNLSFREQFERNRQVGIFLAQHGKEFAGLSEVSSGAALVKSVAVQLVREKNIAELARFGVDCVARFAGNRQGRKDGIALPAK